MRFTAAMRHSKCPHALDLCCGLCALGVVTYPIADWDNVGVSLAVHSRLAPLAAYSGLGFLFLS